MNTGGFYIVDGVRYTSKTVACLEASRKGCPIYWYFYNSIIWFETARGTLISNIIL